MPKISVEISPRIAELLKAGVISISADIYSSGNDVYGRVVQPHPRLGLYPHQSATLEELEPLLAKVRVPEVRPSFSEEPETSPFRTPTKKGQSISVQTEKMTDIGQVPVSVTTNGVRTSLPKASLCWRDLMHLSDDQLDRRVLALGKNIGADKAVSRITSMASLSTTPGATLHKWWKNATPRQRFDLITTSKMVGKSGSINESQLISRLTEGRYPFRGSNRKVEAEQSEEEEEEEESDFDEEFANSFQSGLRLDWGEDE